MKKKPSKKSANPSKPTGSDVSIPASGSPGQMGKIIRRWRETKGLSELTASEALGIDRSTLAGWEQGRRSPVLDDATLPGILRILGDLGIIPEGTELPGTSMEDLEREVSATAQSAAQAAVRAAVEAAFSKIKST